MSFKIDVLPKDHGVSECIQPCSIKRQLLFFHFKFSPLVSTYSPSRSYLQLYPAHFQCLFFINFPLLLPGRHDRMGRRSSRWSGRSISCKDNVQDSRDGCQLYQQQRSRADLEKYIPKPKLHLRAEDPAASENGHSGSRDGGGAAESRQRAKKRVMVGEKEVSVPNDEFEES